VYGIQYLLRNVTSGNLLCYVESSSVNGRGDLMKSANNGRSVRWPRGRAAA